MAGRRYRGIFVSHGAPTLPLEQHASADFLRELGPSLDRPRAILALSPHWTTQGLFLKAPPLFSTWHDFSGFPPELYKLQYRPEGDATLRDRAALLLKESGIGVQIATTDERLDHGVWVPLMLMFPDADVPLVQLSATTDSPARYRKLGRALAPLADDGVLLFGSGGAVHNLGEVDFGATGEPPAWSREFADWVDRQVLAGDWDTLTNYRARAPGAARAHPSEDHFLPLFFAGGAGERAEALHRSFAHGSLSMAAYGFA